MSLVARIEQLAKENGLTFKALEREAGIGNGTIKRWEVQSPRLDILIKVADYLHTSLDFIVFGGSHTSTFCDGVEMAEAEADLVAMFRLLDDRDRETSFNFVTMLYEQKTGEKGSVYSTYTDGGGKQKSDPDDGRKAHGGTA